VFSLRMTAAAPGIFRISDPSNAARQNAAALFANTAWLVVPDAMARALQIPGNCNAGGVSRVSICGQPATAGDLITIFVTGLGKATPGGDAGGRPLPTGAVAPADGNPIYFTVMTPSVTIADIPAQVLFSGLAPGFAGLYQINVRVPQGVPAGDDVAVKVSMPNGTSDAATLAIRR